MYVQNDWHILDRTSLLNVVVVGLQSPISYAFSLREGGEVKYHYETVSKSWPLVAIPKPYRGKEYLGIVSDYRPISLFF